MLDHLEPCLFEYVLENPVRSYNAVIVFVNVETRVMHVFLYEYHAGFISQTFLAFNEEP